MVGDSAIAKGMFSALRNSTTASGNRVDDLQRQLRKHTVVAAKQTPFLAAQGLRRAGAEPEAAIGNRRRPARLGSRASGTQGCPQKSPA
jgi:hypothetical protein